MSSLIDYFFLKSLDTCAVIIIDLYELFQDINRIHDEKYHPCPRWFVLSSATLLPYLQHKHDRVLYYTLSSLLPSIWSSLPRKYYHLFLSRMWWEFHHLLIILDIIILLAIFVHSLVPVLFSTRIPTMELWRVNSKLLATLLLWSEWAIVHSKSFANWITILTLVVQPNPYFGRTFQPMFNCVCFPRAYFLISVDLTNVISLFT